MNGPPPSPVHADHEQPAHSCHLCQRSPSKATANATIVLSGFSTTDGLLLRPPPRLTQPDQLQPSQSCHLCQSCRSSPIANTVSRPSGETTASGVPSRCSP